MKKKNFPGESEISGGSYMGDQIELFVMQKAFRDLTEPENPKEQEDDEISERDEFLWE